MVCYMYINQATSYFRIQWSRNCRYCTDIGYEKDNGTVRDIEHYLNRARYCSHVM
jgi:hypothetical protein